MVRIKYTSNSLNRTDARQLVKGTVKARKKDKLFQPCFKYLTENIDRFGYLKSGDDFKIDIVPYIASRMLCDTTRGNKNNLECLNGTTKDLLGKMDKASLDDLYNNLVGEERRGRRIKRDLVGLILADNQKDIPYADYFRCYSSIIDVLELLLLCGRLDLALMFVRDFITINLPDYYDIDMVIKAGMQWVLDMRFNKCQMSLSEYMVDKKTPPELMAIYSWLSVESLDRLHYNAEELINSEDTDCMEDRYEHELNRLKTGFEDIKHLLGDKILSLLDNAKCLITTLNYNTARYVVIRYVEDIMEENYKINTLNEELKKTEEYKKYVKKCAKLEEDNKELELTISYKNKEIQKFKNNIDNNEEISGIKKEKQSLIKDVKKLEKNINKLESRNVSLEDKVKELESQLYDYKRNINVLNESNKAYEEMLNTQDSNLEADSIDSLLERIRDRRILIIGGNPSMKERLENLQCNIRVIPYEDIGRIPSVNDCDIVGIYYKAISHPDRWSVESQLRNSEIPIVYIGNSNTQLILDVLAKV